MYCTMYRWFHVIRKDKQPEPELGLYIREEEGCWEQGLSIRACRVYWRPSTGTRPGHLRGSCGRESARRPRRQLSCGGIMRWLPSEPVSRLLAGAPPACFWSVPLLFTSLPARLFHFPGRSTLEEGERNRSGGSGWIRQQIIDRDALGEGGHWS
jgi:hypothetical protein